MKRHSNGANNCLPSSLVYSYEHYKLHDHYFKDIEAEVEVLSNKEIPTVTSNMF